MTNKIPRFTVHVRDLLECTEKKIWNLPEPGVMDITFDDNTLLRNVDTCDVKISWYYWKIVSVYHDLEIRPDMMLAGTRFTDDTHRILLGRAIRETIHRNDIEKEDVWEIGYLDIYNGLYNAIVTRLLPYVGTADVPSILEILFDKDVFAANNKITNSVASSNRAHATLKKVWEEERYPLNPTTQSYLNHTVKPAQLYQSYSARTLTTDVDSEIFGNQVRRGFAQGFLKINDCCKESRASAKALLFNKDPVAAAEYFNRKLQFVCARIRRVVFGDCGTTDFHEIIIPDDPKLGAAMLVSLAGLYQVLDNGELREIGYEDTQLIGTRIKFRTTLCCRHLSSQCVCQTCYGRASYALPWDTNPGHVSCTAINKLITQLIISTKHLDFIVHKFKIAIAGRERFYLTDKEGVDDCVFLNKERKGSNLYLRFRATDAENLVKINYTDNIKAAINISGLSSLKHVSFYMKDDSDMFIAQEQYNMNKSAICPALSLSLLTYMQKNGWYADKDFHVVDLSKWDFDKPIFIYPLKNDNMSDFANRFERYIRSSATAGDEDASSLETDTSNFPCLGKYRDTTVALMDTFRLISEKLSGVHIGHIATILAASRTNDSENGDYRMPSTLETGKFVNHDEIIRGMSLSVAMQYANQSTYHDMTDSYIIKDRETSVLDDTIFIRSKKK